MTVRELRQKLFELPNQEADVEVDGCGVFDIEDGAVINLVPDPMADSEFRERDWREEDDGIGPEVDDMNGMSEYDPNWRDDYPFAGDI
jgi:hypothetical protein